MDEWNDWQMDYWIPISHYAKAGMRKQDKCFNNLSRLSMKFPFEILEISRPTTKRDVPAQLVTENQRSVSNPNLNILFIPCKNYLYTFVQAGHSGSKPVINIEYPNVLKYWET